MAHILAVGIATIDIINTVDAYPDEDSEIRASSQQRCRGGNATNTLVVLSQLGHQCRWAGVLVNEPDTDIVLADLNKHQIGTQDCTYLTQGKMPTSYISLSAKTGSRSIVHYRDLPEFSFDDFQKIDFSEIDWVHFEGRNVDETQQMLQWLTSNHPELPCSLEVEKPRDNIEKLFDLPDLILFSKHYAIHLGYDNASDFLNTLKLPATTQATCAWGEAGAWARDSQATIHHAAAESLDNVQDTLGAGDTFNAGFIHAMLQHQALDPALQSACQLAGKKCRQVGFDNLAKEKLAGEEQAQALFLCVKADLPEQGFKEFKIQTNQGELALFISCQDGETTAYQNKCPHLGVPLNWEANKFYSMEKTHIQCSTHGALFTFDKGLCVAGPCVDQSLAVLDFEWREEALWLILPTDFSLK